MRKWVDKYLSEIADEDNRVRLLIADVGDFPIFRKFHPDKFVNVGVSETNCINVAAGMAAHGLRVFVYGVSSFFLYRAFEQLKYSIAYWHQPITFIGVGFGWKYYNIGNGHFSPDDIAICRLLPNMKILTPFCLSQLKQQLNNCSIDSLAYLRITANIVDDIYDKYCEFDNITQSIIVSYGEMSQVAIEVHDNTHSTTGIYLLSDISEIAIEKLSFRLKGRTIITIEDQCYQGSISCLLSKFGISSLKSFLLPIMPLGVVKSRKDLYSLYHLDSESIIKALNI